MWPRAYVGGGAWPTGTGRWLAVDTTPTHALPDPALGDTSDSSRNVLRKVRRRSTVLLPARTNRRGGPGEGGRASRAPSPPLPTPKYRPTSCWPSMLPENTPEADLELALDACPDPYPDPATDLPPLAAPAPDPPLGTVIAARQLGREEGVGGGASAGPPLPGGTGVEGARGARPEGMDRRAMTVRGSEGGRPSCPVASTGGAVATGVLMPDKVGGAGGPGEDAGASLGDVDQGMWGQGTVVGSVRRLPCPSGSPSPPRPPSRSTTGPCPWLSTPELAAA